MLATFKNREIEFDGDTVAFTDGLLPEMTDAECNDAFCDFEYELAEENQRFKNGDWKD